MPASALHRAWTGYYLYVVLDVFSRYVVGWLLAHRESASLAQRLIAAVAREAIGPGQLTVHADRGAATTSKPVAFLLADLGITKTHSRPHVANDNPYSEAQFKTLKYHPRFPDRFGSFEHRRAFSADFFPWYSTEHQHSSLGWHTPHDVHHGLAAARQAHRAPGPRGRLRRPRRPRSRRRSGSIPPSSSAPPRTIAQ